MVEKNDIELDEKPKFRAGKWKINYSGLIIFIRKAIALEIKTVKTP
jgi:hypothetical protein